MKTIMRVSANAALMVILAIGPTSAVSAIDLPAGPATSTVILRPPELGPIQPFTMKRDGLLPVQQADLAVTLLGLTPDGRMTYIVVNRGRTAANSPFVVDLLIDGIRKDTVKHYPLPAAQPAERHLQSRASG